MPYKSRAQSNYIHMMAAKGTPWAQKFVRDSHGTKVPNVQHVQKGKMANMQLGGGGRFAKLKGQLASKGAQNPGALAAYIGRRKYGGKKFAQLSHHGRKVHRKHRKVRRVG